MCYIYFVESQKFVKYIIYFLFKSHWKIFIIFQNDGQNEAENTETSALKKKLAQMEAELKQV